MAVDYYSLIQFAFVVFALVATVKAYLKHDAKMQELEHEAKERRNQSYIDRDIKKAEIEAGVLYGSPFGENTVSESPEFDINSLLSDPSKIAGLLQNPAVQTLLQNLKK